MVKHKTIALFAIIATWIASPHSAFAADEIESCGRDALGIESCRRVTLEGIPLHSIYSAIWNRQQSNVVLTDPVGEQVVSVSLTGEIARLGLNLSRKVHTRSSPRPSAATPTPFAVSKIEDGRGIGYLQVIDESHIVRTDSDFAELGVVDLTTTKISNKLYKSHTYRVGSLYHWTTARDTIFAYGSLEQEDSAQDFILGFFAHKIALLAGENIAPQTRLVMPFEEYDYYMLAYPYMAAAGRTIYFLCMGTFPSLYRFNTEADDTPSYLSGFPGEDQELPAIDSQLPPDELFSIIEGASIPVGLYAQGKLLYSLHRQPGPTERTTYWTLNRMRLDRDAVEVLDSIELPTQENDLTVLPTEDAWIIFEKGSVRRDSTQDIPSMLMITMHDAKHNSAPPQ